MRTPSSVVGRTRPSSQGLRGFEAPAINARSFGAQAWQQLGQVGQAVGTLAEELEQRRNTEAEMGVNLRLSSFQIEQERVLDQMNRNSEDFAAIDQQYQEQFVENANGLLAEIEDPDARAYAYDQLTNVYTSNMFTAQQAERERNVAAIDFDLKKQYEEARNIVRSDPSQLEAQVEIVSDSLQQSSGTLPRQTIEERARLYLQGITESAVRGRADRDPEGVLTELQSGVVRGQNEAALVTRESGGNPRAMNEDGFAGLYQFGEERAADVGFFVPGEGELGDNDWKGVFNIPGHPNVRSINDFLASPEAQHTAWLMHKEKMNQEIIDNEFDRYIGQQVQGVLITRAGLQNMLHLGGVESTRKFLTGRGDPEDSNGTKLSDYARMATGTTDAAGGLDAILSPDQKENLMTYAEARANEEITRRSQVDAIAAEQQTEAQEQNYAQLHVQVARGEVQQSDLVEALDANQIDATQYRTLRDDLAVENPVGSEEAALEARVDVLAGRMGVEEVMAMSDVLATDQRRELVDLADQVARRGGALAEQGVQNQLQRLEAMVSGPTGPLGSMDMESKQRVATALDTARRRIETEGAENVRQIVDDTIAMFPPPTAGVTELSTLPHLPFMQGELFGTKDEISRTLSSIAERAEQAHIDGDMPDWQFDKFLEDFSDYVDAVQKLPQHGTLREPENGG